MLAYPDNRVACEIKRNYLLPRWYGSEEEVLAFGRECVRIGTAFNRIPLVLVTAHETLAETAPDQNLYFAKPQVWTDIKSTYEKLLADKTRLTKFPYGYLQDRAKYLHYAALCKQWTAFLLLAKEFDGHFDVKAFGSQAMYDFYLKKAAAELRKTPA